MKRIKFFALGLSLSIMLTFGFEGFSGVEATTMVKVNPNLQKQTLEGWGANLAWWGNTIGNWPDQNRNEIADLLFADDGLKINYVRFLVGGGDAPSHNHMNSGNYVKGEMEGYLPSAGSYNWNGDAGERKMLELAAGRGANIFEAFANSAPYWMTNSGCSAGGFLGSDNFNSQYTVQFADYLTEVVKHFRDYWNIDFRVLEPFNEPDNPYWISNGGQEGMVINCTKQNNVIKAVYDKITEKGLNVEISANDDTKIDDITGDYATYDATAKSYLKQLGIHTYQGTRMDEVRNLAQREGKRLVMSEYGTGDGSNHDAIAPSMVLTTKIVKELKNFESTMWTYWQPVENEENRSNSWGFIHANYNDTTYQYDILKAYYAFGQFSKFMDAGTKIIDINNDNMLASYDKATNKLVIVAVNDATSAADYSIDLSSFGTLPASATTYRTSATESLSAIASSPITNSTLNVSLPGDSITTYIVNNISFVPNGTVSEIQDSALNYSGTWSTSGNNKISSTKDSYYEYTFDGDRVEIYGSENSSSGMMAISIDDGAEIYVDAYSPSNVGSTYLYGSNSIVQGGTHKVKVRVTGLNSPLSSGTTVSVDKIQVVGSTPINGTFKIINQNSGKALNVPSSSTSNDKQLIQYPYAGGSNERWTITPNTDGTYKITNVASGKVVAVKSNSTADNAAIVQYTDNGGANQKWNIIDVGDGYCKIISVSSGKAIAVKSASTSDSAYIIQYTFNTAGNDMWQILAQ